MKRLTNPILMTGVAVATGVAIWLVLTAVDRSTLAAGWTTMLGHPSATLVALTAFGGAFALRAVAWTRVLGGLSFGQSMAGLHTALGANHLLPLRLGEAIRVVSVVRRTTITARAATASTVTLRAADIVAIALLGIGAGLTRFLETTLVWLVVAAGLAAVVMGGIWIKRIEEAEVAVPGPVAISLTIVAWAMESVVVYQVAAWSGLGLTPSEAILVTSAAIVAQIAAIAPGGFGTYEAGGTAAMVFLGFDGGAALAVILITHAIKTGYSVVSGLIATFLPRPGLIGRLRLPRRVTERRAEVPGDGPVVLFMPAHDEAGRVGDVVSRVPTTVRNRKVLCLVIDDGSSDGTGREAAAAGATVVRLTPNQGLGAAVRVGMAAALDQGAVAIAFCDADGEYAPEELASVIAPILDGTADYVVGSRFAGHIQRMLPHRRFGNQVLTRWVAWMTRTPVTDGQSGYRAFSAPAAAETEIAHDFNYAQVITLDLIGKGYRYAEVPITYTFRTSGESFVRLGRYLRAVIPAVWRELNDDTPAAAAVSSVDRSILDHV